MRHLVSVAGHPSLVRDSVSGAILNINKSGIERSRESKASRVRMREEVDALKREVAEMREALDRITAWVSTR